MATSAPEKSTEQSGDMLTKLLTQSLSGVFDSMKDKLTSNITENGEKYLHEAVERVKESTSGVVAWAKENPVKTALAIAALAAAATFLARTIAHSGDSKDAEDNEESSGKAKSKSSSSSKKAGSGKSSH